MASTTNNTSCESCGEHVDTFKCTKCDKVFCFSHLQVHREEVVRDVQSVHDELNATRERMDHLKQNMIDHPLIQTVDQWQKDSITKIQQLAQDMRQMLINYLTQHLSQMESNWKKMATDIQQSSEKNKFDELHVNRWNDELNQLKRKINLPLNVVIREDSTPLINTLRTYFDVAVENNDQKQPSTAIAAMSVTPKPFGKSAQAIPPNARWKQNGVTIAGGHGQGSAANQLNYPYGLYVDDDQIVVIADCDNHRIVEWKKNDKIGRVVAGGNGAGNRMDQLYKPADVIVDKETDSLIICDWGNKRVMRWSCRSGTTSGETIIDNIVCSRLTMDNERNLYVTDFGKNEVRRYRMEKKEGTIVAGGNGKGDRLNQLNYPHYVFVDGDYSVYVSDYYNHRVMKWVKGAKEGVVVAGGQGEGNDLTQLAGPTGVFVDEMGTVYVAEGPDLHGRSNNHRVTRWIKGMKKGEVIVGGNGQGEQANQLNRPDGLSFDRDGNLYVVDMENRRVQRFDIEKH